MRLQHPSLTKRVRPLTVEADNHSLVSETFNVEFVAEIETVHNDFNGSE